MSGRACAATTRKKTKQNKKTKQKTKQKQTSANHVAQTIHTNAQPLTMRQKGANAFSRSCTHKYLSRYSHKLSAINANTSKNKNFPELTDRETALDQGANCRPGKSAADASFEIFEPLDVTQFQTQQPLTGDEDNCIRNRHH